MLRLMLLRHGKSDRTDPTAPDPARPLNERGRTAATAMGAYLAAESLVPALILCSTAIRTRETCDLLVEEFPQRPTIRYERRLYLATAKAIMNVVAALPGSKRSVLVIGHNPGLHFAAQTLVAEGKAKAFARLSRKFPTAALAVIDFDIGSWRALKPQDGQLERFVTPKEILRTD